MYGVGMLVKFEIYNDGERWCARCLGESIFTQGETLDDLLANMREAASLHFGDDLKDGEEIHIISISDFGVDKGVRAAGG